MDKEKLEKILSSSEIKNQFYTLGYGLYNIYDYIYNRFGYFQDFTEDSDRRFQDFKEALEDKAEIINSYSGAVMLRYWMDMNADSINERLYGDRAELINRMERKTIRNPLMMDFTRIELAIKFMETLVKYGDGGHEEITDDVQLKNNERIVGHVYDKKSPKGIDLLKDVYYEALKRTYTMYNFALL